MIVYFGACRDGLGDYTFIPLPVWEPDDWIMFLRLYGPTWSYRMMEAP